MSGFTTAALAKQKYMSKRLQIIAVDYLLPITLLLLAPWIVKKLMTEHRAAKTAEKQLGIYQ